MTKPGKSQRFLLITWPRLESSTLFSRECCDNLLALAVRLIWASLDTELPLAAFISFGEEPRLEAAALARV